MLVKAVRLSPKDSDCNIVRHLVDIQINTQSAQGWAEDYMSLEFEHLRYPKILPSIKQNVPLFGKYLFIKTS